MQELQNVDILLWRKVTHITHYRDSVEVMDSDLEMHIADVLVLAIPWNSIQEINFKPSIPMELRRPPASPERNRHMATSFLARYNEGFWRHQGYSGDYLQQQPFLIGHEYRPTIYSGLMIHEEGIEPLVRSMSLNLLSKSFGPGMLLPTEYAQKTYEINSLANFPFTTPWNRIVWSSSACTATVYRGCLGGAVQSGLRAAMSALLVLRPQMVTWEDIAEVQSKDRLHKRGAGFLTKQLSGLNLYNVTFYGVIIIGSYVVIKLVVPKNNS